MPTDNRELINNAAHSKFSFGSRRGLRILDIPIRKARCNNNKALHDVFVHLVQDRWVSSSNDDFRVHKVREWELWDHDARSVDGHPTQI